MNLNRLIALALMLAAPLGTLRAQERFSDMIAVTEVEVPVRVLAKGKPVAGLTREDFELYDGGALQTIVGFEVRDLWTGRGQQPSPELAPTTADPASRRLLLVFDFSFSRRQRLARALRDIRGSLDQQLQPTDRVGVATYGTISGLNLLVGFTGDRAKVNLALDAVQAMLDARSKRQRETLGQLHAARFSDSEGTDGSSTYATLAEELSPTAALAVLAGPVEYDDSEDNGVVVQEKTSFFGPIKVRVEVDVTEPINTAQDVVTSVDDLAAVRAFGIAFAELATLLESVGGQKDVLMLSEGFGGGLFQDAYSLHYLEKAARAFRDTGWTLHGIDVGGVPGIDESSFSADSLLYLAEGTGGDLVENVNDFSVATSRVLQRTGIVYVMTFQPTAEGEEGEFHPLEVKLKNPRKGVQIIHRPGYYTARSLSDREAYEQRADAAEWLLTNLESAEIDVQVYAESVTDPAGGTRVPVAVEVDGNSLMEIRTKHRSKLELQLVVLDPDAQIREILNGEEKIDFGDSVSTLRGGGVRFVGELGLPPGEYQLRVLVRSSRRDEVFLATYPLSVGPEAKNTLPPPPPAAERKAENWITVETERRSGYFR
ncbi:MAG: VWA domain-containing protein [Thermoanaerobaculia bacterium]